MTGALKDKKGLTLIEVLVGCMMFAIITIAVSTVLAPTLMAYVRANNFAEYNTLVDNVANQILSDLSRSTRAPEPVPSDWDMEIKVNLHTHTVRYAVMGGILYRAENDVFLPVFTSEFYKGKSLSFKIDSDIDGSYILTVRISEITTGGGAGFELEREYAVRPLALPENQFN